MENAGKSRTHDDHDINLEYSDCVTSLLAMSRDHCKPSEISGHVRTFGIPSRTEKFIQNLSLSWATFIRFALVWVFNFYHNINRFLLIWLKKFFSWHKSRLNRYEWNMVCLNQPKQEFFEKDSILFRDWKLNTLCVFLESEPTAFFLVLCSRKRNASRGNLQNQRQSSRYWPYRTESGRKWVFFKCYSHFVFIQNVWMIQKWIEIFLLCTRSPSGVGRAGGWSPRGDRRVQVLPEASPRANNSGIVSKRLPRCYE